MFEDALMESSGSIRAGSSRWTAAASLLVEGALVAVMLLLPLLYTPALTRHAFDATLLAPPRAAAPTLKPDRVLPARTRPDIQDDHRLLAPSGNHSITRALRPDPGPAPVYGGVDSLVALAAGRGSSTQPAVLELGSSSPAIAVAKAAPKGPVRVSSGVMSGRRTGGTRPVYPAIAKSAGIQGHVVVEATIAKTGAVESARVVSGSPLLANAALEAVRTYRYTPTLVSGQPVAVVTAIDVNFTLTE